MSNSGTGNEVRWTFVLSLLLVGCGSIGTISKDGPTWRLDDMSVRRSCKKCGAATLSMQRVADSVTVVLVGHFGSGLTWKGREVRFASPTQTLERQSPRKFSSAEHEGHRDDMLTFEMTAHSLGALIDTVDVQIEVCSRDAPTQTPTFVNPAGCDTFPLSEEQKQQIVELLSKG